MNEYTIKLSEELDYVLGINFVAEELFKRIDSYDFNKIILDFDNIKFVGRSFVQENLFQKSKTDKEIVEINIPENTQKMFEIVSKDFD